MNKLVITVSQLNTYVKSLLDGDSRLCSVFVMGEISNFTNHYRSGHLYMSIKDDKSIIHAVMFRSSAERLKFIPCDGMKVILRGRVSLYDRDGQYQLYIDDMQPDGVGALSVAYEQLKIRLDEEGLFNPLHKKKLPFYPFRAAVITSLTGAAVRDIINVMGRRSPATEIVLFPVTVQGAEAAPQLIDAVKKADSYSCDIIIIGRGGGSIEDLWAFNDEYLARAIYNCKTPVISAVGHETDFTICDFVADMRAPTPSAAAELAVPEQEGILAATNEYRIRMTSALNRRLKSCQDRLELVKSRRCYKNPESILEIAGQRVDRISERINNAVKQCFHLKKIAFITAKGRIEAYNPLGILSRGYSVARIDNKIIRSSSQPKSGDDITLTFSDGSIDCTVK